jgi:methylated-DNA-[protein]-cysteine S-methyltransferase
MNAKAGTKADAHEDADVGMGSSVEGAYFQALDCYLMVERLGQKVKRVFFSEEPPAKKSDLADEIVAYVEGIGPLPDAELDLSGFTDFQRDVYSAVQGIPRGQTLTYGEVAILAGRPGAARAVGQAMARNRHLILVPCHRVVARGGLGGFGCGLPAKKRLLKAEARQTSKSI